jgi:hypothetical protein
MGFARAANRSIIVDARQESSNESHDRVWRRWRSFCSKAEVTTNPYLTHLSTGEGELFLQSFLSCYRTAKWKPLGEHYGVCDVRVGAGTVRKAAGHLDMAFRDHHQQSPIHVQGPTQLLPFAAPSSAPTRIVTPPPSDRKPSPQDCCGLAGVDVEATRATLFAVVTELAIVGYFFATRSYKITTTPKPGRTVILCLRGLIFWNAQKNIIPHHRLGLATAIYLTLIFVNQKNKQKMDARTQKRTNDLVLCPVCWGAALVGRIHQLVPGITGDTPINTVHLYGKTVRIASDYLPDRLRTTCTTFGGKAEFGFHAKEIGTKSLPSGAAMLLFLKNRSSNQIMIMGRWLSKVFLDYIWPQVLEWTHIMSWTTSPVRPTRPRRPQPAP